MTDSHQSASGTGIAQASGTGASATVIIGLTPEEIVPLLSAATAAAQARIDEPARQLNTSREAVLGFLRTLREDEIPTDQLAAKFALIAQRYVSMMERLAALDPEDAEAREYIERAQQILRHAVSASDYERADALLLRAEDAADASLSKVEDLEREAREAAGRLRRAKAATRAERAELSLTRLDYLHAASHFDVAASLVEDPSVRFSYLDRAARALASHGEEKGDNSSLARAIEAYRELLREHTHERMPRDWAATLTSLGNALWRLGERESGTANLEEAVAVYHLALTEHTRERMPLDWAATQNNLGNALSVLGGRRETGA